MFRTLTSHEKSFIIGIAARLDDNLRHRLMNDLASARAEALLADGALIRFHLDGYQRPKYTGQRLYPVEGTMADADGSPLQLLLFADPADRLFELEFLRWEEGLLQNPDWSTLQFVPDKL